MSLNEYFRKVDSWTEEMCGEKMDKALPFLLDCLKGGEENAMSEDDKTVVVLVFNRFAPLLSLDDLEKKIFSKISLVKNFDNSFQWIEQHLSREFILSIREILERMNVILTCLFTCISHATKQMENMKFQNVYNMCTTVLSIAEKSYKHCKERREIYQNCLEFVAESLNSLFLKTGYLLMTIQKILSCPAMSYLDDIDFIISVLESLRQIALLVNDADLKMMATVWKLFIKISTEHADNLKTRFEIGGVIENLVDQVLHRLRELRELTNDDEEKKALKIVRTCGFVFRIIVLLCEKYKQCLGDSHEKLLHLILFLYTISAPSLDAVCLSEALRNEMSQHLTVGVEPLISHMLNERLFIRLIIGEKNVEFEGISNFSRSFLFLTVINLSTKLESEVINWMMNSTNVQESNNSTVLSCVFNLLPKCHAELTLPLRFPGLANTENTSFYECIRVGLCNFVSCLPAKYFPCLEVILLKNLLNEHFWCRQMAADIWSFLAKLLKSALCFHHCCVLATILSKCEIADNFRTFPLISLLNRLVNRLEEGHLQDFISTYSDVIVKHFHLDEITQEKIFLVIKTASAKDRLTLNKFIISSHSVREDELVSSLNTLHKVAFFRQKDKNCFPQMQNQQKELANTVASLWKPPSLRSLFNLQCYIVESAVLLTSDLISYFSKEDLLTVFRAFENRIECLSELSRLHIVTCLSRFRDRKANDLSEESLKCICKLFIILLQDNCWLVMDSALEEFSIFAHETQHEWVIENIVRSGPRVQKIVKNYLKKIPWESDKSMELIPFLRMQQETVLCECALQRCKAIPLSTEPETSEEKVESGKLNATLTSIEQNMTELKRISSKQMPPWVKERLLAIKEQLNSFL